MKPGNFKWAESDTHTVGPDAGLKNTRNESPKTYQEDGLYKGYVIPNDIMNYQLHRSARLQKILARMHAMNVDVVDSYTTASSFSKIESATHGVGNVVLTDPRNYVFYYFWGGAGVYEVRCDDDQVLGETLCFNPGAVNSATDSDHENSKSNHHRIVVQDDGAGADWVYYATTLAGAFAQVTFTAGAPAYDWRAVGCNRNSAGSATWLIGSAGMGGGPTSYIWRSTDGINFANVAGWPGGTVQEDIQFIGHTCHEANAKGPDDAGNPYWLVLSDTYAARSTIGTAWTAAAHGMNLGASSLHARCAAYSRTAGDNGRWIVPRPGNAAGDVYYSDDNGATWSTFSGVIPEVGSVSEFFVSGDGHGTFVATWTNSWPQFIVSVDEGETWSSPVSLKSSTSGFTSDTGFIPEFVIDEASQAYDRPNGNEYLSMGALDSTTDVDLYRSMIY